MISAIIPVLNAADTLPACLAALEGAGEVIVVDGGSTDGSAEVARHGGARLVAAPKGRGNQLRAGADAASGAWLLFVHADTLLSPSWREAADAHIACSPHPACFRFRLDDSVWKARLIEKGVAVRVRLLGLPYGDQGLLVSRAIYDAAGGYRPLPLMEDVDLVRRIGRVQVLGADAVTSAARWRRDGWARRSVLNASCLALFAAGVPAERIARFYA